ncbi:response regulator [Archangium gephyra]|uniref:response regulator n=1 Tax=Archangium gephyra TaxID=48 RepID=UPI0035D50373
MTRQPTALLVEDDGAIREALTELLETRGYQVNAVATAEQGMARLRAEGVCLLVTDYVLPGKSGGWLVRQGRAEGLLQTTLIVMVTALLQPPELADVRVLRKPLDLGQLLAEVGPRR